MTTKPSKRIARISTTQGYATFSYDFERLDIIDQALTDVRLYNEQDVLEAHYQLDYEHALSSIGLGAEARLLLKQITNKTNGANLVAYRFDYNTTVLPSRNSDRYDHWGYVNDVSPGIDYNTNKYGPPAATVDGESFPGVSRAPNATTAKGLMLQKITYAAGGHTRFEYEGHRAGSSQSVGGVRIHKIYQNDGSGTNPEIVKTYDYHDSGITPSVPQYGYFALVPGETCKKTLIRYSQSLTNLFDLNGTHIGYGKVTERLSDGSSTTYQFTNFNEYADILTPIFRNSSFPELHGTNVGYTISPFAPATSKNWQRGLVEKVLYTDQDNQTVKKTSFTYNFATEVQKHVTGLLVEEVYDRVFDGFYYYRVAQYKHISQPFFLDYKIEEVYDQGDDTQFVSTRTDYEYDPTYLQVKKETTTDSEGTEWVTEYGYPTDFAQVMIAGYEPDGSIRWNGIAGGRHVGCIQRMLSTHRHSQRIQTTRRRKKIGESQYKTISGDLTLFSFPDGASSLVAYPEQYFQLYPNIYNLSPVFTITEEEGILRISIDADYYPTQTFEAYDKVGNLLQSTARNDIPTSQLYSYKNSLPIAQVVGAQNNQIAYTSFEAASVGGTEGNLYVQGNIQTTLEALTGNRVYQSNSTLSSLSTISELPAGEYVVSLWAKGSATGASIDIFGKSGEEVRVSVEGNGQWNQYQTTISLGESVRLGIGLVKSMMVDEVRVHPVGTQMTTYTYDPLVGVTSETDANNVTTYYEYDDLNRLRLIKDQHRDIRQRYQYVYKSGE